jgi:acyl-CoA synthetase (AMP-forming)/AMP-acid ligase II
MDMIPALLRCSAARFEDRDYIVTANRRLTFGEAELQSRRLAKHLLRAGIGKGTRVGILFPQGPDFVVALLAVCRIGAVAVPLSTFFRGPELCRAVRHVDVHMLLAQHDAAALFEAAWPELSTARGPDLHLAAVPYLRRISLSGGTEHRWASVLPEFPQLGDEPSISDQLLEEIESEVTPADLMVMVHTSGATAEPKAVVHTHGAQVRRSEAVAALHGVTYATRTFTTMPFFWVGGLTVILLSHLHAGAMVITVERMDVPLMLEMIERWQASRVIGWTLVERITGDPALAHRDLSWLAALQVPSLAAPGRRHNALGMTETCGPHTGAPYANTDDLPDHWRGSFGPPLAGLQHKIVDPETGGVQADGVEGEICVRGYSRHGRPVQEGATQHVR